MKRRSFLAALGLVPLAVVATRTAVLDLPVAAPLIEAPAVEADVNMLTMLQRASANGIPVPLKMWMVAAQINVDQLMADLQSER